MNFKDYYEILGLERSATQDEVKRAYRKLARKYHPDVNKEPGAEDRFKEAGEAYEVLKDPEKRAAYDQLGANWKAGQDFQAPPDWNEGFEFSGGGFTDANETGFSDFFETLFGRARASGGQHRSGHGFHAHGQDHYARITIDLQDSYEGAARTISLQAPEVDSAGHVSLKTRSIRVSIPKGVTEGKHIRLAGQGTPGVGQGKPGDLYLEIAFREDGRFSAEGKDVYFDLPITPWEAAMGGKVKAPTPTGVVELTIPQNAHAGQKLRLKGRGLPANPPGDLYAVLQIAVPPAKTDEDRKLYEQMARQMNFDPRSKLGV
ncbi:MAG: DnaJ C-terminal domain-containing protein [Pseudomonadota bacterium]